MKNNLGEEGADLICFTRGLLTKPPALSDRSLSGDNPRRTSISDISVNSLALSSLCRLERGDIGLSSVSLRCDRFLSRDRERGASGRLSVLRRGEVGDFSSDLLTVDLTPSVVVDLFRSGEWGLIFESGLVDSPLLLGDLGDLGDLCSRSGLGSLASRSSLRGETARGDGEDIACFERLRGEEEGEPQLGEEGPLETGERDNFGIWGTKRFNNFKKLDKKKK